MDLCAAANKGVAHSNLVVRSQASTERYGVPTITLRRRPLMSVPHPGHHLPAVKSRLVHSWTTVSPWWRDRRSSLINAGLSPPRLSRCTLESLPQPTRRDRMMEVFECTLEQSMSASGKTSDAVAAIGTLVTILENEAASLNRLRAEREQRTTDRWKGTERRAKEKERRAAIRAQREEQREQRDAQMAKMAELRFSLSMSVLSAEERASAKAQYTKLLQETLHAPAGK